MAAEIVHLYGGNASSILFFPFQLLFTEKIKEVNIFAAVSSRVFFYAFYFFNGNVNQNKRRLGRLIIFTDYF